MLTKARQNKYRDTITLIAPTIASDGAGGYTKSGDTRLDVPAFVVPKSSRAVSETGAVVLTSTYKVEVRYVEGIEPTVDMLVDFAGERFSVIGISPVDTWSRVLVFEMAKAGANG